MTLTVVIGSSGSGKTTFLNDVHKSHKCTYIRQYHTMRPYIVVSKIPNFDPSRLPYWDIYKGEGTAASIKVGGTMAGAFTAGLSGGQRKLLLFELICQRTANQSDLLIVLDEPFAGVTDDFVPFITQRLNELRVNHNVLLVTNDHVQTLTEISDNTITVSAVDRSVVRINARLQPVDRSKMISAISMGKRFSYETTKEDLRFILDVEVFGNESWFGTFAFAIVSHSLFLACFWGSSFESTPLVVIAGSFISFYSIQPFLITSVDWRNAVNEEAEALLHASNRSNKRIKFLLFLSFMITLCLVEYGVINAVVPGFGSLTFLIAILFDNASFAIPYMLLGVYTNLSLAATQALGGMTFLFTIFFSTTFSPGSGIAVVKEVRYLFPRFYFWCELPGVQDLMEGCPEEQWNILYPILSSILIVCIFGAFVVGLNFQKSLEIKATKAILSESMDDEYKELQIELYGQKVLRQLRRSTLLQQTTNSAHVLEPLEEGNDEEDFMA